MLRYQSRSPDWQRTKKLTRVKNWNLVAGCPHRDILHRQGGGRRVAGGPTVPHERWATLANRMAVDVLRNPFYSSRHPRGSHVSENQ